MNHANTHEPIGLTPIPINQSDPQTTPTRADTHEPIKPKNQPTNYSDPRTTLTHTGTHEPFDPRNHRWEREKRENRNREVTEERQELL